MKLIVSEKKKKHHDLRKAANRTAQSNVKHSALETDLCFASCLFSRVVFLPTASAIDTTVYCNFTNFRCVKISVDPLASDHGAFGLV